MDPSVCVCSLSCPPPQPVNLSQWPSDTLQIYYGYSPLPDKLSAEDRSLHDIFQVSPEIIMVENCKTSDTKVVTTFCGVLYVVSHELPPGGAFWPASPLMDPAKVGV